MNCPFEIFNWEEGEIWQMFVYVIKKFQCYLLFFKESIGVLADRADPEIENNTRK